MKSKCNSVLAAVFLFSLVGSTHLSGFSIIRVAPDRTYEDQLEKAAKTGNVKDALSALINLDISQSAGWAVGLAAKFGQAELGVALLKKFYEKIDGEWTAYALAMAVKYNQKVLINRICSTHPNVSSSDGEWVFQAVYEAMVRENRVIAQKILQSFEKVIDKDIFYSKIVSPLFAVDISQEMVLFANNMYERKYRGYAVDELTIKRDFYELVRDSFSTLKDYVSFFEQLEDKKFIKRLLLSSSDGGRTALHLISYYSLRTKEEDEQIAAYFLANGADPLALNNALRTPLHTSCCEARVGVSKALLAHGGFNEMKDEDQWTPDDYLSGNGEKERAATISKLIANHVSQSTCRAQQECIKS